jgi:hypothetical protein
MTSAMGNHEWKELCDRYNRYGGEMFIFCMVNNVDLKEFAMWHKKLSQPSKQFIPVELQREDAMPLATIDLPQGIRTGVNLRALSRHLVKNKVP